MVNFNFGSVINVFNFNIKQDFIVGQFFIVCYQFQQWIMEYGFWACLYMLFIVLVIFVLQGDFFDWVLLEWEIDFFSVVFFDGYVIFWDGVFLGEVELGVLQYIDFNVQVGEFYEYSVYGCNQFGNGVWGYVVGFVNFNGIVIGKFEFFFGNLVANVYVMLMFMIGCFLWFDGVNDNFCIDYYEVLFVNMWMLLVFV